MQPYVSRQFRQFILNKYPVLKDNEPFIRFLNYLCFGNFFDKDTHHLVLPTTKMAEDFYQKPYDHHFNGKAVLEDFRDQVLPDLEWTTHTLNSPNSYKGKARQISNLGFDAEMQDALHWECLNPSKDQVDLITGEPHLRKDRYQKAKAETAQYERELAQLPLNATQSKILGYLRDLPYGHLFLRKFGENKDAVQVAIGKLAPEVQEIQYRILASASRNPRLYYAPSANGRTCRLSAQGDSILGLKKEIRRAATKGWVECDLRSSQFAILAAKLEAPLAQAFIASGESIWREFNRHLFGVNANPSNEIKKVLKETIYSICFGKSVYALRQLLLQHGIPTLLDHPILQELLTLRTQWFERIEKDGGAVDVWGQWHALDQTVDPVTKKTTRWAGAIAGTVIQSVEMEIIAPIFDVAEKHGKSDQFTVCLFQHDGGTISFNDKTRMARAQTKLKKAVEDRAKELGVSTVLGFTQL